MGFDGFLYWSKRTWPYFSRFWEIVMCESGASNAASVGVLMIWAPKPFRTFAFSVDIFYGMVIVISYPLTALARASPIPVLPEVASTILSPGWSLPVFSASRTIRFPILS